MSFQAFEFPPEKQEVYRKARLLEWVTLAYLASVVLLMYLVMGSSQAMKSAWVEDLLSLIPAIVFLAANRIAQNGPDERFRYGYHRVMSIAFLCASLAMVVMGGWLLVDSLLKLLYAEHPSIGSMTLFGQAFWLGWLMFPVLLYGAVPPVILGRMKLPLARRMHDKVLYVDADMNKADWMTAVAAIVGVAGVGVGWWWTDAVAGALISLSILNDGGRHLVQVVADLMDEVPMKVDGSGPEELPDRIRAYLERLAWVDEVVVRMRDEGHVFFGEALVKPADETDLLQKAEDATRVCREMDWRLYDFRVIPVASFLLVKDSSTDPDSPGNGDSDGQVGAD